MGGIFLSFQKPWYAEFSFDSALLQNIGNTQPLFPDAETVSYQQMRMEKAREQVSAQLDAFPSLREKSCASILTAARQISPITGQPLLSAMETYFCHAFFLSSLSFAKTQAVQKEGIHPLPTAQTVTMGAVSLSYGGKTRTPAPPQANEPPQSISAPSPFFSGCIDRSFGSYEHFQAQWREQAESVSGAGFLWLVRTAAPAVSGLSLYITRGEETPYTGARGLLPVLCLDLWEHAYFLRYRGDTGAYASAFLNAVRWETAEERLLLFR